MIQIGHYVHVCVHMYTHTDIHLGVVTHIYNLI